MSFLNDCVAKSVPLPNGGAKNNRDEKKKLTVSQIYRLQGSGKIFSYQQMNASYTRDEANQLFDAARAFTTNYKSKTSASLNPLSGMCLDLNPTSV